MHSDMETLEPDFLLNNHTQSTQLTHSHDITHAVHSCSLSGESTVIPKRIGSCKMFAIQALLQAHTERLEQQQQAQAQQLSSKHVTELQSTVAAFKADHQQQMQAAVEQASSKHARQIAKTQQQLEKAEAMLAAEKQKSGSLKVMMCMFDRDVVRCHMS